MHQIFVFFAEDGKVGVNTIKNIAERMRDSCVNRAIMVSQTTLTPFARQCIAELASKYLIEAVRALHLPRLSVVGPSDIVCQVMS